MSTLLEVRGLSKSFGGIAAVRNVSFELQKGELLAFIGPNGAGKTTCFNMLMGELKADSGTVLLNGRQINRLKPRQIWRLGVGRTFQITQTYPSMTVCENVQMALISYYRKIFSFGRYARNAYRERALELLHLVEMDTQSERPAAILAYGDLKRLELAVALANEPQLLLMDEPTAGMAPGERVALMQLTANIVAEKNIGVLFTEHDMDVVFAHAGRIMVLNQGQLIANGSVDEVRNDARVREVYLGGGTTFAGDL
ncbi:MAG TPA: ABC transporter ATP-binding protein [Rhizobiales bacterium]|nr:ABC transporter ATP-binding protein [Hyphomicrobiales bacterium]